MLRTLRGRRRPRYGAHICAIIAALLLLLSVSVLHSRLGFDRRSQVQPFSYSRSGLGLGFPSNPNPEISQDSTDDIDAIVANPLLEDVENDGSSNGDDDRIDELDIVEEETDDQSRVSNEEEILRGVELEEESESDGGDRSRTWRSGYFWDHAVGVMRRSFDKRSIDQWEDQSSFDFSLKSEDRSKIAFGSDDQPVDEDVRVKLGKIKGIEDALMLKTSRGGSPLREGWASWFEKKGDFLRRDRMFKSNLELLNPLSNPLLQDPDGVGLTVLTRGDKLVQTALLNELQKLPFVVKKSISGVNAEGKGIDGNMEGRRNEVKRVERRTLDETVSDVADSKNIINDTEALNSTKQARVGNGNSLTDLVMEQGISSYKRTRTGQFQLESTKGNDRVVDSSVGELGKQSDLKNMDSEVRTKSELTHPKYADGRTWGYFPGLYPHLSFSDFMDEFFRQCKWSMRVFMVWNSPPWMYSVRHQRGLESLLYHQPDACVVVFSETIELDFFKDFVKDGFKVAVAMPNLDELLKNTPTHIFASLWFEWRKTNFYSTHYSELVRLAALYKYGGLYLDSDIIVLKPLSSLNNSVGMEDQLSGSSFNGPVMAFRKHSPFIMECLKEFYSTYDDTLLRWNGADLLTRVGEKFLRRGNNDELLELKMQRSFMFFPIGPQSITRYFTGPANETERAQQDILFRKILNESFTFHFWNSITSSLVPEPESLVSRILNHHCVRCLDVL